jgi:hypothetical protein
VQKLKRLLPASTDQPSEVSFEGTTYEVVLNNNHEISEMNTFKLIDIYEGP